MNETEAIQIITQFIGWAGLLAMSPLVYRLAYAFSYYLTGRLKKKETIIIQLMEDGVVIKEAQIQLDSKSPVVQQLNAAKKVSQ